MSDTIVIAVAYYTVGINFCASAEKLAATLEVDTTGRPKSLLAIPMYFLASHAAEVYLKAALLKRGYNEKQLRSQDNRHNLTALLIALQDKRATISLNTVALIHELSEQHRLHQLRYSHQDGAGTTFYASCWPTLAQVFESLDELLLLCRVSKS
jgi:HEPN domain-containing protein